MTDELISKKSLLKEIDEVIAQYNWAKDGVIIDILVCVRDMVFDHPIAYDVDKVIEQLEEASCYIEDGCGHAGHLVFTDDAIEIVKKGGIE